MSNVIQFPTRPLTFIQHMQAELCEDDYLDFLEGVESEEVYQDLDLDMQNLIDAYIENGI